MKRLGVIIPSFLEIKGPLGNCIGSVLTQETSLVFNVHIVIVDGDSSVRAKDELYPVLMEIYKSTGQPLPIYINIRIVKSASGDHRSTLDIGYGSLYNLVDFIAIINSNDESTPGLLEEAHLALVSDAGIRHSGYNHQGADTIFKSVGSAK